MKRFLITISGIVQGVGFRPFIYRLATAMNLNGRVSNNTEGVIIEIEGSSDQLAAFIKRIETEAPPISVIREISYLENDYIGYKRFLIKKSTGNQENRIFISPDVGVCNACLSELRQPENRRYRYPFINCTNCGPRFTIITGSPYDRHMTTMAKFKMCEQCEAEYQDVNDRRYHAQPIACYHCGPTLGVVDNAGNIVQTVDPVAFITNRLKMGDIIAIKGIGGYHLACDAVNASVVKKLRQRKKRDHKPFAVMVGDIGSVSSYVMLSNSEISLLQSPQKPIVLLNKKEDYALPDEIAPMNAHLGVMLPYTPIHALLFSESTNALKVLVMTSANKSNEPIFYKDEEAITGLGHIADYFLLNNREIYMRTDDSVTRVVDSQITFLRRSRGYTPLPIQLSFLNNQKLPSILAVGGEMKNAFCLSKGKEFFLSHHIGDMGNFETFTSFEQGVLHFEKMFNITPEIVAHDMHPDYLSSKFAHSVGKTTYAVQHHHAHIAACMAEHEITQQVIGVAFDGTGYGEDGHIWGGEFFSGGYQGFNRGAQLEYVKMPGGEAAIREPWRMAVSYLDAAGCQLEKSNEYGLIANGMKILSNIQTTKIGAVQEILKRDINSPLTSSMGRLFDAVSAVLGIQTHVNFEGQAAMELEYYADDAAAGAYEFGLTKVNGILQLKASGIFPQVLADMKMGCSKQMIASKFHHTVSRMVLAVCKMVRNETSLNTVALSGGVFQNIILLRSCQLDLKKNKFTVLTHQKVPSNDGGIALGQAVLAMHRNQ